MDRALRHGSHRSGDQRETRGQSDRDDAVPALRQMMRCNAHPLGAVRKTIGQNSEVGCMRTASGLGEHSDVKDALSAIAARWR